ncbi:putative 2-dehydropantoate 2-reductase [Hypsizygus marmoreus]|uniref:2-dehydropantoate 2-reductase n=1 Tax=Hypsizygus marmoreus TaxID=39966 RepID=A0A369KDE6_HYPMA|nr:putative 2-dehydropantoate 2-reductase [Hypsizygus marmoreus]
MRFHILGLGSIGSLLAHNLRRVLPKEHSITLIHKTQNQAAEALTRGGAIHVENQGLVSTTTGFRSEVFEASSTPSDPKKSKRKKHAQKLGGPDAIESLFITTKAHHTLPAIRRLLPRLSSNTTVVLLQNGMGIYEELTHDIFRNPEQRPHFILATNTHGAFRKGSHNIVHAGVGNIAFGIVPDPLGRNFEAGFENKTVPRTEQNPRISDISPSADDPSFDRYKSLRGTVAAMLLMEPLNVSWRPIAQVQTAMRRKLVVNAVINPLTALMGCRNGGIFTTTAARRILQRVCQEASDVFAAQIKADNKTWLESLAADGVDTNRVPVERLPRSLTRSLLEDEILHVAEVTKGNISSMLSDVRRGIPTEIDYINGYLLKLGSTYHVDMPATAMLLNLVKMRSAIPLDQML